MAARKRKQQDWSSHGDYMDAKVRKLDQQFSVKDSEREEAIFKGVAIFINGYTNPPADELRKLVCCHGGRFQQYYSRSIVTHIIATNLPDSKIIEIRDKKVVCPQWILDCIKQSRLLPIDLYLLYDGRQAGQKKLNFTSKKCMSTKSITSSETGVKKDGSIHHETLCNKQLKKDQSSLKQHSNTTLQPDVIPAELCDKSINSSEDLAKLHKSIILNQVTNSGLLLGNKITNQNTDLSLGDKITNKTIGSSLSNATGNPMEEISHNDTTPNQKPIKAGDTNFVNEFYNNSRLHYLSTWGAELKQYTSELIKSKTNEGVIIPLKHAPPGYYGRVIMHVDMDCFFVSVGLRDQPGLVGKPVAVCHAGKNSSDVASHSTSYFTSMSEIASCSYEARKAGVRNGMFLGAARKLCADIVCIPYNFQQYRQVSRQLYQILVGHTHNIEAVSCDEAYIDVSLILDEHTSPLELAKQIREEIKLQTRCTASIGIGHNMLLSRLSTRMAKPNGQYWVREGDVQTFIAQQKVADLPGVGYSLRDKLNSMGVNTCAELQTVPLHMLQDALGDKTGATLHRYGRGEDDRSLRVEQERKSVSAEINYGIRFTKELEPIEFINELAQEVQKRLKDIGSKGQSVTLKLKVRRKDAPEPRKYMGHGICDNIARSASLPVPTDDGKTIATKCHSLLRQLKVLPADIRGMGIQVHKLTQRKATTRTLHDFVGDVTPVMSINVTCTSPTDSPSNSFYYPPCTTTTTTTTTTVMKSTTSPISKVPFLQHDGLPPLPKFSQSPQSEPKYRDKLKQPEPRQDVTDEELVLPSLSQLDASILNALPSDLRQDIEKQYSKKHNVVAMETAVQPVESVWMHTNKPELHETSQKKEPQPNLEGAVTLQEVKNVLKQWTATSAPFQEDIDVVVQYLMQLIESKNIESNWILLKYLIRCISKTCDQVWTTACEQIIQRVQLCVIEKHGAPLAINQSSYASLFTFDY